MSAPVFLLSDFGTRDAYVGVMRAVIATWAPDAPVHDLVHELPPHDVAAARAQLAFVLPYLPNGSVLCAVVDPGVGGARRAVAVRARREDGARIWAVAPDNGLLSPLLASAAASPSTGDPAAGPGQGRRWRALAAVALPRHGLGPDGPGTTFDGRDVFAPAAARLARGDDPATLGTEVPVGDLHAPAAALARRDGEGWTGSVTWVDRFGNLITNLGPDTLPPDPRTVRITVAGRTVWGLAEAFSAVERGAPVAYLGSGGTLEIALRDDDAAARWGVRPGAPVRLEADALDTDG